MDPIGPELGLKTSLPMVFFSSFVFISVIPILGFYKKFIQQNKDQPFLAVLAFYSVHTPLIGRPDLVAKYKKKAATIEGPEFGEEEMVFPKNKGPRKVRILQKHAVYAAMVEAMVYAGSNAGS